MSILGEVAEVRRQRVIDVVIKVPVIEPLDGAPYTADQIASARELAAEVAADAVEQFLRAQPMPDIGVG